jgi:hypothetical protein
MTSDGLLGRVPLAGGAVMAQLYAHEVPAQAGAPVPCWSYVSEGLRAHDQPEVVLTLRRQPGESEPPEGGLRLLERVAARVLRGQHVENGGLVELGPDGPFGDPAPCAMIYAPAPPLAGVDLVSGTLAIVLLFGDELEVARRCGGPTRVLTRLGYLASFAPFPPWNDRAREPLADALESILTKAAGWAVPDAWALAAGEAITLHLPSGSAPLFAWVFKELPSDIAVTLYLCLPPAGTTCLAWWPDWPEGAQPLVPPGGVLTRYAPCCLGFAPEAQAESLVRAEDGVMALIKPATWAKIRQALATARPLRLRLGARQTLAIEWFAKPSPRARRKGKGDAAAPPRPAGAPPGSKITMKPYFFWPEDDAWGLNDAAAVEAYAHQLGRVLYAALLRLPDVAGGCELSVDVALAPGRAPTIALKGRPAEFNAGVQTHPPAMLYAVPAPAPPVEVSFQLCFEVRGSPSRSN